MTTYSRSFRGLGLTLAGLLALTLALFIPRPTVAQTVFEMGTGGSGGMYWDFGKELSAACGERVGFKAVVEEAGSAGNVAALLENRRPWAFAQMDYLAFEGLSRDLSSIVVLAPLFPEQVLVLAAATAGKKEGGFSVGGFTLGAKTVALSSVKDLVGMPVASFGGAHTTASLIKLQGGVSFDLLPAFPSFDAAKNAVLNGQAAAMIVVQAKKPGPFRGMNAADLAKLRLLPIPPEVVSNFKVYKPVKADYPGWTPVATMEVMSGLITVNYKKGPLVARTAALRSCLQETADELGQMPGRSPAWGFIKAHAEIPWARWEAPATTKK